MAENPKGEKRYWLDEPRNVTKIYYALLAACAALFLADFLYVKHASGGTVSAPQTGDPAITSQSASLGDPLSPGAVRSYQVYYRDPLLSFCPSPPGNSWNISNGIRIQW